VPDLAALEHAFAAALTARPAESADVTPFPGAAERTRARLRLYRGNVQANARKALANAHPVCARLVGDAFFEGLAYEYAARTPSRSGDLNEYGDGFAAFLAAFVPVIEQVPYLPDVARLEWQVHVAHCAADARPFDAAGLAGLADERLARMRLVPAPATALVESCWPIASIWRAHGASGDDVPGVNLTSGGECALVFRPRYRVEVVAVDAGAAAFLAAILEGATFGSALDRARAAESALDLDSALKRWIANGVIAGALA
jgi:hypothetical protein